MGGYGVQCAARLRRGRVADCRQPFNADAGGRGRAAPDGGANGDTRADIHERAAFGYSIPFARYNRYTGPFGHWNAAAERDAIRNGDCFTIGDTDGGCVTLPYALADAGRAADVGRTSAPVR
jgi:hypothetical protein